MVKQSIRHQSTRFLKLKQLFRIQKWFCEKHGWKIESVDGDLSNISTWQQVYT